MPERTYKALASVVRVGRGLRAGETFKTAEHSRATRQVLAFGLIAPVQSKRVVTSRGATTR